MRSDTCTRRSAISTPPPICSTWLKPRLVGFRAAYPNIRFCINGEGDAPMRLGQADCEISFSARRHDNRADILFREFLMPLGSPENVARSAKVIAKERLEGFPLQSMKKTGASRGRAGEVKGAWKGNSQAQKPVRLCRVSGVDGLGFLRCAPGGVDRDGPGLQRLG